MGNFKTITDFIIQFMNSDGFVGIVGALSMILSSISNKAIPEMKHDNGSSKKSTNGSQPVNNDDKNWFDNISVKIDVIQNSQEIMMDNIKSISDSLYMVNERLEGVEKEMKNLKRESKIQREKTEQHDRELIAMKSREETR